MYICNWEINASLWLVNPLSFLSSSPVMWWLEAPSTSMRSSGSSSLPSYQRLVLKDLNGCTTPHLMYSQVYLRWMCSYQPWSMVTRFINIAIMIWLLHPGPNMSGVIGEDHKFHNTVPLKAGAREHQPPTNVTWRRQCLHFCIWMGHWYIIILK